MTNRASTLGSMNNVIYVDFKARRPVADVVVDEAALREADVPESIIADLKAINDPHTGHYRGSNYDPDMPLKDIAKLVRSAAVRKFPGWSFSVRSSRQHIAVRIVTMPNSIPLYNRAWLDEKAADPHAHSTVPRYSRQVNEVLEFIEDMLNSYNYDKSDMMTDYFDTRFYSAVDVDNGLVVARRSAEEV